MDLLLLVVIVLFMVIMEHIKTWSKTLILSKVKMVKLFNFRNVFRENAKNLNCTNFSIYATCCNIFPEIYIGQTINHFSIRWNTHCHIWNKNTLDAEKAALSIHYHKNHTDFLYKNKSISECYTVTFLQPSNSYLDICESHWIHLLDASINIQATVLPIQR